MTDEPHSIRVPVPGRPAASYEILIEGGCFSGLGELVRETAPAHRHAVISDSRVAELYGKAALEALAAAGCRADLFTFPAGEWNKTREEWSRLTDRLLAAGYGRDAAIVALGGGVTGDLAGFIAATYMRSIPVVQVPTTLLAMVDSSVGGKTGVDTQAGKNLVGAFHHPRLVLVDPRFLSSLPAAQRASGLAEVVKTASIRDEGLFDWLEERAAELSGGDLEALEEAVVRSVRHKVEVVAADPEEGGYRAILNFGHTVGHALELLGGYEVLHGEAVAAGMRAEARLGELLGVTRGNTAARIRALLEACGLDREVERERRPDAIWEAASRDKKARGGRVRCVLLRQVGEVARGPNGAWTHELPPEEGPDLVREALGAGAP